MPEALWAVLAGLAGAAAVWWVGTRSRRRLGRMSLGLQDLMSEVERLSRARDEERQTLAAVLSSLDHPLVLVGADDGIRFANAAARELLGPIPPEMAGVTPPRLQRMVREARRLRQTQEESFEHGRPARVVKTSAIPVDQEGRVLLVISDVTEVRRLQAIRRDFVADASHELKTPVSSILAAVEALQLALDRDPQAASRFAGQIEASARSLAAIISELLDLSRLEAEVVRSEPVRLDLVAAEEVDLVRDRAASAGVEIVVDAGPTLVVGDASDLGQAVRNLLDNAIRYTDTGGKVSVRVQSLAEEGVLEVEDTGIGIPSRALARVFERFYRVEIARSRPGGGTGLGLAIVKHVAERHGGSISVESELGEGSVFRLRVPLAAGDGAAGQRPTQG